MEATKVILNGVPRLQADGRMVSPGFGRLQQPNYWAVEKLDQFMDIGYDLFFVQLGELGAARGCWDGEDGYDYRQDEAHIRAIIEKYPVCRLIMFLGGKPPVRWQKNHPEEMILQEDGKRLETLEPYAQLYAQALEDFIQNNPYQFFNFYDMWHG